MKRTIIVALSLILVLLAFTSCEEEVHVHTWDKGTVTKAATGAEKGVKTYICTGCKETKTEDIAIDPNNHTWDEGTVTKAASCTEKGVKTFTCTACKETKVDEIPALGHDLKVDTVDSGYLTKGSKTSTCMRKGCDFQEEEELEVESLAGKWMKTSVQHVGDVYLAFSNEGGRTNKIYLGYPQCYYTVDSKEEECVLVHDLGMNFEYSITSEGGSTKIIITNDTGNPEEPDFTQESPISEDLSSGIITIDRINLNGSILTNCQFSIVPAHDFTISDETKKWVYAKNQDTHLGGWICTEEIEDKELRFILRDDSEPVKHTYKNGFCEVCGYKETN